MRTFGELELESWLPPAEPQPAGLTAEVVARELWTRHDTYDEDDLTADIALIERYAAQRAEAAERERDEARRQLESSQEALQRWVAGASKQATDLALAEQSLVTARAELDGARAIARAAACEADRLQRDLDAARAELEQLRATNSLIVERNVQLCDEAIEARADAKRLSAVSEQQAKDAAHWRAERDVALARERALREAARRLMRALGPCSPFDPLSGPRLALREALAATPDSAPAAPTHDAAAELERAADAVEKRAKHIKQTQPTFFRDCMDDATRTLAVDLRARAAAIRGGVQRAACGECERVNARYEAARHRANAYQRAMHSLAVSVPQAYRDADEAARTPAQCPECGYAMRFADSDCEYCAPEQPDRAGQAGDGGGA